MDRRSIACGLLVAAALGLVLASDALGAEGRAAAGAAQPKAQRPEAAGPKAPQGEAPQQDASSAPGYLAYSEKGLPGTPGAATLVGRVLGSLALVVGLIVVAAFVVKRWLGGRAVAVAGRGKVSQLVEVTPLGGKRFLYLIRVADRLLVVGAGGERMELLSEIRDPEVLGQVEQAAPARKTDFLDLLRRVRGGHAQAEQAGQEAPVP